MSAITTHPREKETTNFKAIYDADLIVNLEENQKEKASSPNGLASIIDQSFLTDSGRELASNVFLKTPQNPNLKRFLLTSPPPLTGGAGGG